MGYDAGTPCKTSTSESTAKRILLDCSSAADDEPNVKQPKAVASPCDVCRGWSYVKLHA
jgi:hypothetical protein